LVAFSTHWHGFSTQYEQLLWDKISF
jgi:hypothetical protein